MLVDDDVIRMTVNLFFELSLEFWNFSTFFSVVHLAQYH